MSELLSRFSPEQDQERAPIINSFITTSVVVDIVDRLAATPGPSQTIEYTRVPTLEQLLRDMGANYRDIIVSHDRSPRIIIVANLDDPSYLIEHATKDSYVPILPNCTHAIETGLEFPAVTVRYNATSKNYETVSSGHICSDPNGLPYYRASNIPHDGFMKGTDRVVFSTFPKFDSQTKFLSGIAGNLGGVAACVAAIGALARGKIPHKSIGFIFPDERYGPPAETALFARGIRRAMKKQLTSDPDAAFVVAGHEVQYPAPPALYAEYSGKKAEGAIVPPEVYRNLDDFASYLTQWDVSFVRGQHARVPLGDEVGLIQALRVIVPLGYGCTDIHFQTDEPHIHVESIVNTAKVLAWIGALS